MNIQEIFYYGFYKIYKLFQLITTTKWLMKSRSFSALCAIQVWFILAIYFYYKVLFYSKTRQDIYFFVLPAVIVFFIDIIALRPDYKWKNYIAKFEQWPEAKNRKGTWIVAILALFVLINLVVSVVLYGNKYPK